MEGSSANISKFIRDPHLNTVLPSSSTKKTVKAEIVDHTDLPVC